MDDETLILKFSAIFWGEFVKAAQIEVDSECFDVAVSKGALANVRRFLPQLKNDYPNGPEFTAILDCCRCAGERALILANSENPPSSNVRTDMFDRAFESVKADSCRKPADKDKLYMHAKLCV
jgi:hypothetical protein